MFDAKLKEGVEYFEQMLKVMPEDRTTLEFLAVAYPQMGEDAKAEAILADLARVLLKEGDIEHATALLPRLEECNDPKAKLMAVRIRASAEPRPDLVPESAASPEEEAGGIFAEAIESEAVLADKLGEAELAGQIRTMTDNGSVSLVSALSFIENDKGDTFEATLAKLCDEYREPPVPIGSFVLDKKLVEKLGENFVKTRGVLPFAMLGKLALVAYLSPHDDKLKARVERLLDSKVKFFLAIPSAVEAAIDVIWPKEGPQA